VSDYYSYYVNTLPRAMSPQIVIISIKLQIFATRVLAMQWELINYSDAIH